MNKKSVYRNYRLILLLGAFFAGFGFFSKISAQEALNSEARAAKPPQWGYYTIVRRDFRKCISPVCGGFFIKQNNLKASPCVDGFFRDECYVSSIDWSSLNLGSDELAKLQNQTKRLVIRGVIDVEEFGNFGDFGTLRVREVFKAATDSAPKGTFAVLKDNGIVCVTTPCFSTDRFVLNKPKISQVSSIDLSQVGATPDQVEAARKAIFGQGLIAAGRTQKVDDSDSTNRGTNFVAKQFYLKVETK